MKFGNTSIPGSLFKVARDRMLLNASFEPAQIREFLCATQSKTLFEISSLVQNHSIIAHRVTRCAIDELMASGDIARLKRGAYMKASVMAAANCNEK